MHVILAVVGLFVIFLGAMVWRFRWINLLSNVDINQVDHVRKAALARYAGCFIMALGSQLVLLAYLLGHATTERAQLILLACMLPVIMATTVIYIAGLGRYMK